MPQVLIHTLQVNEIRERCEIDFLFPEESKEPHQGDSALSTWDSERTVQHVFTIIVSKNARKTRNPAIPPHWNEPGR